MASITSADSLSSQVSGHPMTSRVTLRYGAFHRRRLRNGFSVFDILDLGDINLFALLNLFLWFCMLYGKSDFSPSLLTEGWPPETFVALKQHPEKKNLGLIARMQWKERFEGIEILKTITNRFFKDIFKKQIGTPTRSKNGNWPIQVFCGCQHMLCFDFNRWDTQRPRSTFMENPEKPNQNSNRNWFLSWWILRSLPQVVQMFDWFFSLFVNHKLMKDDFFLMEMPKPRNRRGTLQTQRTSLIPAGTSDDFRFS